MSQHALHEETTYESTPCPVCGVLIFAPASLLAHHRKNSGTVYCYNGHPSGWFETEATRLRKELDAQKRRTDMALSDAANETRMRKEAEAKLARTQKRVQNGVCPCCKRSFQNLRRHMNTKHPEAKHPEAKP